MLGGLRPQAYVHNPMEWVDPLGLTGHSNKNKKTTYEANSRREAFRLAKRDAGIPSSQEPTISRVYLLEENEFGKKVKVLDTNGVPIEVRQYHYTNIKGEKIVIQEHSLGHSKSTPLHGDVPHFNVRPISNLETGSVDGTHGHYNF